MNDKKKPKGTAKSNPKNIVSYTSPKYGSTLDVDTSGYASGAKRFSASMSRPKGSLSKRDERGNQMRYGVIEDFVTTRKGAERAIKAQQGKSKNADAVRVPVRGGVVPRGASILTSRPKRKKP